METINEVEVPASLIDVYKGASAEIARWTEVRDAVRDQLKEQIGDSGFGTVDGVRVCSVISFSTTRMDTKTFKNDHPELYNEYLYTSESTRLSVTKDEE